MYKAMRESIITSLLNAATIPPMVECKMRQMRHRIIPLSEVCNSETEISHHTCRPVFTIAPRGSSTSKLPGASIINEFDEASSA